MSLCIPMVIVIIHTIIDHLQGNENRVYRMADEQDKKWLSRVTFWNTVSRLGLPIAYILLALAIIIPGLVNKYSNA